MSPRRLKAALLAIAVVSLGACNSAPTLPLPPPVVSQISAPSAAGLVTVEGTAKARAFVTLYNEETEHGVVERADEEGQYVIVIEGRSGDSLLLWQASGRDTGPPVSLVVPN